jgi:hypothetical protein
MANAYIGVYKGNPTLGGTDGTRVSEGDGTAAISITLNATNNEVSAPIKLALRCANTPVNYQTVGNTTVSLVGTNNSKWKLILKNSDTAPTQGEIDAVTYNNSLTISTVVGTTNYIFWAIAKATSDETPQNDTSVDISVSATIEAV